jgi:hypothetical protein
LPVFAELIWRADGSAREALRDDGTSIPRRTPWIWRVATIDKEL